MTYFEGFIVPVPEGNKAAYKEHVGFQCAVNSLAKCCCLAYNANHSH